MIFTEHGFVFFFAFVFLVHWGLRGLQTRKIFLLLASYSFYAFSDWRFLSLILISTLADYIAARSLAASDDVAVRRRWLLGSIGVNLGLLGVFKYFGFFVGSVSSVLEWMGLGVSLPVLEIALPVGISFYTFQTMSYTLDVHARRLEPTKRLLDMALFVGFFPQLVAGPIVRAREFLPQLERSPRWADVPVKPLLWMFLVGFFKKACISDNICLLVDAYYVDPSMHTGASGLLVLLVFAVQLYCDFSGYSDMAIAVAGLLGYSLPKNFDFPFLASNASHFWNRWHMTLTRWLHDYVFANLGGRLRDTKRRYFNLLFTMALVGLWHGAAWHFVLWGLLQGIGTIGYRIWHKTKVTASWPRPLRAGFGTIVTFSWFVLGGVLFRAADLGQAGDIVFMISGIQEAGLESFGLGPWILMGVLAAVHIGFYFFRPERYVGRLPNWAFASGLGILTALCLAFTRADVRPFIYFQF
jgi:alginate O-acetyltransferase complex protein AlgI